MALDLTFYENHLRNYIHIGTPLAHDVHPRNERETARAMTGNFIFGIYLAPAAAHTRRS